MSKGFLNDRKQVEKYVESEREHATPSGWTFSRRDSARLCSVHVSDDLQWFIVTYGSNDIGPGALIQEFQTAHVIPKSSLEPYPLRSCVQFIMQHCKPNEWGYT